MADNRHQPDQQEQDRLEDVINQADLDEETAAEVSPVVDSPKPIQSDQEVPEMEQEEVGRTALGWTALILSILALFFFPVLLGLSGAITGFFAYRTGARTLGVWSIAIGLFALVMGLFLMPYFVW